MKKLITILIIAFYLNVNAQTYVAIPDSNFVHYLKSIVPTAFKGDSLNTSSTLVTTTTHKMYTTCCSITDLTGIQYFTSLTLLDCHSGHLTNIPALPNSLDTLNLAVNHLTNLPPVLPNSLLYFNCAGNHVTCFPPFPTSIIWCNLNGNPFTCLPNFVLPAMNSYTATPVCAAGNTNGCVVLGIEQYNINDNNISIYPNPSDGSFQVSYTAMIRYAVNLQITV